MKIENIKERLADLACRNFNQMSINYKSNLFEYDIDAFQLLYFAMDIEKNFDMSYQEDTGNWEIIRMDLWGSLLSNTSNRLRHLFTSMLINPKSSTTSRSYPA